MGAVETVQEVCKVWRRIGKYVYKFVVGDGVRRSDLKCLICLILFVICLV